MAERVSPLGQLPGSYWDTEAVSKLKLDATTQVGKKADQTLVKAEAEKPTLKSDK